MLSNIKPQWQCTAHINLIHIYRNIIYSGGGGDRR